MSSIHFMIFSFRSSTVEPGVIGMVMMPNVSGADGAALRVARKDSSNIVPHGGERV